MSVKSQKSSYDLDLRTKDVEHTKSWDLQLCMRKDAAALKQRWKSYKPDLKVD